VNPSWKLKELGVPKKKAISHGNSRKGPWHISRSLDLSMGMNFAWLTDFDYPIYSRHGKSLLPRDEPPLHSCTSSYESGSAC
jgi:hypothetical protein